MLTGAGSAVVFMPLDASGGDAIAFFGDDFSQGFAGLHAVDVNAVGGTVDVDLGLWVELLDGGFNSPFAVAAGHACDGEGLVHGSVPLCFYEHSLKLPIMARSSFICGGLKILSLKKFNKSLDLATMAGFMLRS